MPPPSSALAPALNGEKKKEPAPPVGSTTGIKHLLRRVFGKNKETLKEALEELIEEHEEQESRMAPEERAMLRNILEFRDTTVGDVMIPRMDILAVPQNITLDDLKKHVFEQRHTRIPIYGETLDFVLGFIHAKDLMPMLSGDLDYNLEAIMRPMLFVPPNMPILDLLVKMRNAGSHMAVVIDEYGGTDGLVTMEDLFEEIVGDIQDEHDEESVEHVTRVSEGIYEASARLPIDELHRQLAIDSETEGEILPFDTLGGLIAFKAGRVPEANEIITLESGVRFEIIEADNRRIHQVRILLP